MESIADRLDLLMRKHGIRGQSQLSRESGVAQSTINRILKQGDAYSPSWQTLRRLADYFNVSVLWLAEGSGEPQRIAIAPTGLTLREIDSSSDDEILEALAHLQQLEPVARRAILSVLFLLGGPGRPH